MITVKFRYTNYKRTNVQLMGCASAEITESPLIEYCCRQKCLSCKRISIVCNEGQFTCWKSVRDFFRTKGFMQIFDEFFLKTKGFLPEVYEIFWSEMPLGLQSVYTTIRLIFSDPSGFCLCRDNRKFFTEQVYR